MPDPVRFDVELAGKPRQVVCKPWPYRDGRRWLTRIVRVLGAQASKGGDVEIGGLLEDLPDSFLDELLDACEAHTDIVTVDELGKPSAAPFASFAGVLAGRYEVTLRVLRSHVELNFAPFFASLAHELSDLRGGAEKDGAGAA